MIFGIRETISRGNPTEDKAITDAEVYFIAEVAAFAFIFEINRSVIIKIPKKKRYLISYDTFIDVFNDNTTALPNNLNNMKLKLPYKINCYYSITQRQIVYFIVI